MQHHTDSISNARFSSGLLQTHEFRSYFPLVPHSAIFVMLNARSSKDCYFFSILDQKKVRQQSEM